MDALFVVGLVANVAGIVTFVDWAALKSRARKKKQPLKRSLDALEKLEVSLREINDAINEKKALPEIKHHVDLLSKAKIELVKDLREMGIDIPREEPPRVRGVSDEALLAMVSLCERSILQAKNELKGF